MLKKYQFIMILMFVSMILLGCSATTYTVQFESQGGNTVEDLLIQEGQSLSIPEVSREGYTLDGWYTSLDDGESYDEKWSFIDDVVHGDVMLYAKWIINQSTVSFDTNGASSIEAVVGDYDEVLDEPDDPIKEGYTFDGWYSDETFNQVYTFSTMPASDITLYAKWILNAYTLKYLDYDGTILFEQEIDYGTDLSTINLPEHPTREGYIFDGWDDVLPTMMPANDMTLTATYHLEIIEINIGYLPMRNLTASDYLLIEGLEELMEEALLDQGFQTNIHFILNTSGNALIEEMDSGNIQVGFMPTQYYAYATLSYSDEFQVLLSTTRSAYAAQVDVDNHIITDKDTIIANVNTEGYQADTLADVFTNSYYSMLLVRTEDYAEYQANGLSALEGKTVGVQSETSSSGYVYPSYLLYQNGLEFVTGTPGENQVEALNIGGHTNAVLALLNGEVDAIFTFFDARYITEAYASWQNANPTENIFDYTSVAALTEPIYNDVISSTNDLSEDLQTALQEVFVELIDIPEGLEALSLFNHSGYTVVDDSIYDSERAIYQYLHSNE
jgi:uncharacterized repeat protein (TIGR02543 family)